MKQVQAINGPVEVGLRVLILLVEAYPVGLDLQQLVAMDYILVHTGDVEAGPESIHPPSPLRAGEVAVRRGLVKDGLKLFRSRKLLDETYTEAGIYYVAGDSAGSFLDSLTTTYTALLRERAEWTYRRFGGLAAAELAAELDGSLGRWQTEFAVLAPGESV
jgi:hypothetical protein